MFTIKNENVVIVDVTDPLSKDGGIAEDHGATESGSSPGPDTRL